MCSRTGDTDCCNDLPCDRCHVRRDNRRKRLSDARRVSAQRMQSPEENKALVGYYFEELEDGNLDVIDEVFSEDYSTDSEIIRSDIGDISREGLKRVLGEMLRAFPDTSIESQSLYAEGDAVISIQTWRGTHQAEYRGIPPRATTLASSHNSDSIRRRVDTTVCSRRPSNTLESPQFRLVRWKTGVISNSCEETGPVFQSRSARRWSTWPNRPRWCRSTGTSRSSVAANNGCRSSTVSSGTISETNWSRRGRVGGPHFRSFGGSRRDGRDRRRGQWTRHS